MNNSTKQLNYLRSRFYTTNDADILVDILFEISKFIIPNDIRGTINYDFIKTKHGFLIDLASVLTSYREVAIIPGYNYDRLNKRCPDIWKVLKEKYKIIIHKDVVYQQGSEKAKLLIQCRKNKQSDSRLVGYCLGYPKIDIDAFNDLEFRKRWKNENR